MGEWAAVETGIGEIHAAMFAALPPERAAALCMQVTVDLDTTDVEVYGRGKRGLAYNHQDQRVGRPHPHLADWAETRRCWPRTCARCGGPRRLGR
jgi:hypothetical protein